MLMKKLHLLLAAVSLIALSACSKKDAHDHHHHGSHHGHHHEPPHGGTPVILGNEDFHLELVRDAAAGSLTLYVLDSHMSNFIRIPAPSVELVVKLRDGRSEKLSLAALPNMLSGETVGDTSAFVGQADWLKSNDEFEVVITSVTVRGRAFDNVAVPFPKGHEANHHSHAH
jgi:hypothetical protein